MNGELRSSVLSNLSENMTSATPGNVTDKKGEFYEHTEYTSSGESWVNEKVTGNADLPYKYTSKEQDAETGLYYYGARYYDARTSRWISTDPILESYLSGKPAGGVYDPSNLDLYSYVGNNPIKYVDPDGKHKWVLKSDTVSNIANRQRNGEKIYVPVMDSKGKITGSFDFSEGFNIQGAYKYKTSQGNRYLKPENLVGAVINEQDGFLSVETSKKSNNYELAKTMVDEWVDDTSSAGRFVSFLSKTIGKIEEYFHINGQEEASDNVGGSPAPLSERKVQYLEIIPELDTNKDNLDGTPNKYKGTPSDSHTYEKPEGNNISDYEKYDKNN